MPRQILTSAKIHVSAAAHCAPCDFGKPWRVGLREYYVERLDALRHYYYELSNMRADLVSIREGLSSPESGHLTLKHPTLSGLSEDLTATITLLKCAEEKLFNLVPREEFASPT
jgi:hypothetical protein